MASFIHISLPVPYIHFSSLPYMLHVLSISTFSILNRNNTQNPLRGTAPSVGITTHILPVSPPCTVWCLTLSNPIFLPTTYSPALIYLSLPFSCKHSHANATHNHLFTSKYVACRETERVQPALSVGQSPYYMRKSIRQAPTAEQAQQNRVGHLPTLERNRKIIMSDEVRHRIGKG